MRLSATERIIREAEEQEAESASSRGRDSGRVVDVSPATVTARDLAPSHAWPSFDVDLDEIDLSDDEDKTLVNEEKAAAALREMRSYDGPAPRQPSFVADAPPSVNPPNDRGPVQWATAPRSSVALLPPPPSPRPTLVRAGGVPPAPVQTGPPLARIPESTEPRPQFSMSLQEAALLDSARPRHGVSRRKGILITVATTVATAVVALVLGGWTADLRNLAAGALARAWPGSHATSVIPQTRAPHARGSSVIVSAIPHGPKPERQASKSEGPMAAPPSQSPSDSPAPVGGHAAATAPHAAAAVAAPASAAAAAAAVVPGPDAAPASRTVSPSRSDTGSPALVSASAGSQRGQQSATNNKSGPSHKLTSHKSRRRAPHPAKGAASRSRPNRPAEVASPQPSRAPGATPRNLDPDSTLPITE